MKVRAAIYARISSDREGEGAGVGRQLDDCRALIEARGWAVAGEYVDNHASAWKKNSKRPEYDRLVADFHAGRFDALVCYDLDRLTRQPRQLEDWIDAAKERGLRVITANGEADLGTDAGVLFAGIKAQVARAEVSRMAARIKRASDERHKQGLYHGGTVPYGYRVKDKRLVPHDDEKANILEAVDRLLKGDTVTGITKDWQAQGRTTRSGKRWRVTGLRVILRNRALLGETKLGEVKWEPILDRATFDRLDLMFTDPARRTTISPGVKGGRYSLGGGLCKCGLCGATLTSYKRGGERNPRPGLRCAKHTGGCGHLTVDFLRLEEHVFDTVIAALEDNDRWKRRQSTRDDGARHEEEATLDARKADLLAQAERVRSAFIIDGEAFMPEAEMRAHLKRINDEVTNIDRRIGELLGTTVLAEAVADGLDWRSWNVPRRRNFLRLLVAEVVVGPWPEDVPRGLPRRKDADPEEHRVRLEALQQEAMERRVEIRTR